MTRCLACMLLAGALIGCAPTGGPPAGEGAAAQPPPAPPAPPTPPSATTTRYLTPAEAAKVIARNRSRADFVIVDGRTAGEYGAAHVAGAVNIDCLQLPDDLRSAVGKLDRRKSYLLYCVSGSRCAHAERIMREMDFREVFLVLGGGLEELKQQGVPVKE